MASQFLIYVGSYILVLHIMGIRYISIRGRLDDSVGILCFVGMKT